LRVLIIFNLIPLWIRLQHHYSTLYRIPCNQLKLLMLYRTPRSQNQGASRLPEENSSAASSFRIGSGSPPVAGTRYNPSSRLEENKMTPLGFHRRRAWLGRDKLFARVRHRCGSSLVFSAWLAKNAISSPSGDQNGATPFSVPGMTLASEASRARSQSMQRETTTNIGEIVPAELLGTDGRVLMVRLLCALVLLFCSKTIDTADGACTIQSGTNLKIP
jgi:hypothetical protein